MVNNLERVLVFFSVYLESVLYIAENICIPSFLFVQQVFNNGSSELHSELS